MKIEKAIELKKLHQHWLPKESYPDLIIADNMSIEALEEVARARRLGPPKSDFRLPGETEE